MMALAYLKDVPKTSDDYLYYRAVTWCFFSFQLCVAVERAFAMLEMRSPSTRREELSVLAAGAAPRSPGHAGAAIANAAPAHI